MGLYVMRTQKTVVKDCLIETVRFGPAVEVEADCDTEARSKAAIEKLQVPHNRKSHYNTWLRNEKAGRTTGVSPYLPTYSWSVLKPETLG